MSWKKSASSWPVVAALLLLGPAPLPAPVVFETTSAYHHILVVDQQDTRTLYFDNAMETKMSLSNPLRGHFEYADHFHMPWLWNDRITNVLMIGLGGGSTVRSYQHYYPHVMFETVELDPRVVQVARDYFHVTESPTHKITIGDGRLHLRRSRTKYDVILMDAYTANRYGSFIPYALATREFFALASDHLTTNGVLAYNVIGTVRPTRRENIVGALYQTMSVVFPQVYHFPSVRSQNVVLLATKSAQPATRDALFAKATELMQKRLITLPEFKTRLGAFRAGPPPSAVNARVLTDDFAPVDGLLSVEP